MKILLSLLVALLLPSVVSHAAPPPVTAQATDTITIPVDSPAFVFSPGNWTGDDGRSGKLYRQTWNPYSYFRIMWKTTNSTPLATILLDTSGSPSTYPRPNLAYCIDGIWRASIPCTNEIVVPEITNAGSHTLTVFLQNSQQRQRWGSEGSSPLNVLRVTGLKVNAGSSPVSDSPKKKWALIVGDSITEGIGTTAMAPYSYLLGEALQTQGYDYGINACGWSGWINKGDNPPGDVPGYYCIKDSTNGSGGQYDDAASRWNKIDGNHHSLLDTQGHLSAYGQTGQEPSLILINYGTNDSLHKSNPSDTLASIVQSLAALRKSAPDARIILLIPFGQYCKNEIREAIRIHNEQNPADNKVAVIDLGPELARNLGTKNGLMGGLHPNDKGDALIAARLIPQVMAILNSDK